MKSKLSSEEINLISDFYRLHKNGFRSNDLDKAQHLLDEIERRGLEGKLTINMIRDLNAKLRRKANRS